MCRATFFNSLTYASQAWWDFANAEGQGRLQGLVNKAIRWELDGQCSLPNLDNFCAKLDKSLFQCVLKDPALVLHQLLPPVKLHKYFLRERPHDRDVPYFTALSSNTFFARMLNTFLFCYHM